MARPSGAPRPCAAALTAPGYPVLCIHPSVRPSVHPSVHPPHNPGLSPPRGPRDAHGSIAASPSALRHHPPAPAPLRLPLPAQSPLSAAPSPGAGCPRDAAREGSAAGGAAQREKPGHPHRRLHRGRETPRCRERSGKGEGGNGGRGERGGRRARPRREERAPRSPQRRSRTDGARAARPPREGSAPRSANRRAPHRPPGTAHQWRAAEPACARPRPVNHSRLRC